MSSEQTTDPRVARSRAAVLEAAAAELAERGFGGFAVDRVVARSGVAKTTIYRHWPSKAELLHDAIASFKEFPSAPDLGSVRDDVLFCIRGLVFGLWELQDLYLRAMASLIEAAERDEELSRLHARMSGERSAILREVLERGQRRGEIREDVDINLAVAMLVGPPFLRRLIMRDPMRPAEADALVDAVLDGIGTAKSAAAPAPPTPKQTRRRRRSPR